MTDKKRLSWEELREAHINLWGWLALNPDREEGEWPGWSVNGGKYWGIVGGFACEAAGVDRSGFFQCDRCPLDQGVMEECDAYFRWRDAESIDDCRELAIIIRDSWVGA